MKKTISTNTFLFAIALISVVLLFYVTSTDDSKLPISPSSVRSDGEYGTMVLRLWLEANGYHVRNLVSNSIQPGDLDVIFILNPSFDYTLDEAKTIQAWVSQGNTLIVAGNNYNVNTVLAPYAVSLYYLDYDGGRQSLTSPTLITPPFERLKLDQVYGIKFTRSDIAVHLELQETPVIVSFPEGRGTVWVSGTLWPFTNQGIQEKPSASLILNFLTEAPREAQIGFDEAQHGYTEESSQKTLRHWLFTSVPGWSVLSVVTLTMIYLLLRGRRFGHAVPLREERLRREPVEYIQAMANLLRRSGQRSETLRHYQAQFKRYLFKRYGFAPDLSDDELVERIAIRDPMVDSAALKNILKLLARKQVSEQELVYIAGQVDTWIRKLS